MKAKKKRYRGTFNYNGYPIIIYKSATSANHAFTLMTREIAKQLNLYHINIKYYFNGVKDNFLIEPLTDLEEDVKC